MPFSILLLKKCITYGIDGITIKSLHMFDLQALVLQFEIKELETYFYQLNQKKLQERGISEVEKVDGNKALKLFGR